MSDGGGGGGGDDGGGGISNGGGGGGDADSVGINDWRSLSGTIVPSDEASSSDISLEVGDDGGLSSICPPNTLSISVPFVKSSSSFSSGMSSSRCRSTFSGSTDQLRDMNAACQLTSSSDPPWGIAPFHHPLIPRIISPPSPSLHLLLFLPSHFLIDIENSIEKFLRHISRSEPVYKVESPLSFFGIESVIL